MKKNEAIQNNATANQMSYSLRLCT